LEGGPRFTLFGTSIEERFLVVSCKLTFVIDCSYKRGTAVECCYTRTTSSDGPRWRGRIQGDLSSWGCMSLQLLQKFSALMTKCRPSYRARSTRCTIIRRYFPIQISSAQIGG
jgi:hypothetical protein